MKDLNQAIRLGMQFGRIAEVDVNIANNIIGFLALKFREATIKSTTDEELTLLINLWESITGRKYDEKNR